MARSSFTAFVAILAAATAVQRAAAQDTTTAAATPAGPNRSLQVDPSATCPYQVADQIQACRAVVYADEAALPGGPCTSTAWDCICNVQQGLVACYDPCPGTLPSTDLEFNRAQCAGQNGYTNKAANNQSGIDYMGSPLTTTLASGFSQGSTSAAATTSTDAAASTTATTSAVTTTAASGSTTTTGGTIISAGGRQGATPPSSASSTAQPTGGAASTYASKQGSIAAGLLVGAVGILALVAL